MRWRPNVQNSILKEQVKEKPIYEIAKRFIDIICSLIALIVLMPILIIVAILIKIESSGPIIFCQNRVGKGGAIFKIYKFRSMVTNAEALKEHLAHENERSGPMFKIKNDPRVTKVGRIIRRTSIDELPQLLNILKGDMSIVGPRPSLPKEVEQFEEWMLKRLTVKPGLTCYWQVSGRNDIEFNEWMELDIKYVNERNVGIDILLILKTFSVLFGDSHAS
ncbi:sugar transferase [Clostridium saccharobutylicum]|uniref:Galactosyl transferase CpsE n=1 Tax=Clostridium saccharobutylicum DSM 13864 TaxID=1345695 RepID=U5MSR3_CLOSA|nr:sugar transferase [Clostridium saccharobutylicum]AGX43829.1 galactosyl transferase CpsE [Clostridium saccharobutylicum DSM 13864]MBC2401248.1 sugar transferase [Clostridium saccharobutylicum]MBC2412667.1 sugar transferase [Clostridium saccharobutylicum]MBC2440427.1 sugar transferase [Clostridium saccharobutylicum]MBC2444709.1 sugar transferase [Clostridium saccharobutylicum]